MSLSKIKQRLKHYKSLENITIASPTNLTQKINDISHSSIIKTAKPRRDIQSRLATQIHDKIVTSKQDLKRYASILKMNSKLKKKQSKTKSHIHNKHNITSTKRTNKEKKLGSPVVSKFKSKKQFTQGGSTIFNHQVKEDKKTLKKIRQKSQAKWKFQYTQSIAMQKSKKSISREALSRKKSPKKVRKMYTDFSLDSTPSCLFTQEVELLQQIGQGTFGKVFKGRLKRNRQIVAVKRVIQDSRYKNRQIEIVKVLHNDFICEVISTYITQQGKHEYLNIIMKYYDQNLFQRIKSYPTGKMPYLQAKIIIYQLFKGLSYLHSLNISHRDIKPENILLKGNKASICDFGSAKILMPDESNISYICARCYRAPQLIFGATKYSTQVDIWSAGCVILEIMNGDPLFIGQTSINHLLEIIKVMGTPSHHEVLSMNAQYQVSSFNFPRVKKKEWQEIFPDADPLLLCLLRRIMVYSPRQRATALEVLSMEYFDELRDKLTFSHLSSMYHLPNFFQFSKDQLQGQQHLIKRLIPNWCKQI